MYVDDPRLKANYNKIAVGLAEYYRDAMAVYADSRLSYPADADPEAADSGPRSGGRAPVTPVPVGDRTARRPDGSHWSSPGSLLA